MYHIYSIKRHGVYLIFRDSSAAFIRGKRLYEGGVHLKFNLFLVNNSMVTEHFKGPLMYIFGPVARDIHGYIVLAIFLV